MVSDVPGWGHPERVQTMLGSTMTTYDHTWPLHHILLCDLKRTFSAGEPSRCRLAYGAVATARGWPKHSGNPRPTWTYHFFSNSRKESSVQVFPDMDLLPDECLEDLRTAKVDNMTVRARKSKSHHAWKTRKTRTRYQCNISKQPG